MSDFFLAMLGVALLSTGARDQMLLARLSARLGQRTGLLLVAGLATILTSAAMVIAGMWLGMSLGPSARQMFVALALALAAIGLLWPVKQRSLAEPTQSLFAILAVVIWRQSGDGARFYLLALAAGSAVPVMTGLGGAVGAFAALALGWAMGADLEQQTWLRPIRIGLAGLLLIIAITLGLLARGLIG